MKKIGWILIPFYILMSSCCLLHPKTNISSTTKEVVIVKEDGTVIGDMSKSGTETIVMTEDKVPVKIVKGQYVPFDGFLVTNVELLKMMDKEAIEIVCRCKKGGEAQKDGYVLSLKLVEEKDNKIKLKGN